MAYTIKQARPVLLEYLGLTESTANYITDTDNWGILFEKNGQKYVIFIMPLGENTSSPKIYFDIRDSGAEKFVAAWNYAEQNNYKFFCLGVKDESAKYKNYVISVEADIHTVLKVSGLENGRRSGAGTQLNVPSSLVPEGNITRAKSNKFDIFFAVINKSYIFTYLEVFDNRLFQFINSETSTPTPIDDFKDKPRNRIMFGAPGTGKSHKLDDDSKVFKQNSSLDIKRVKDFYDQAKQINAETNSSYKLITLGYNNSDVFFDLFKKFDTHEKLATELQLYNDKGNLSVGSLSYIHWGADLYKENVGTKRFSDSCIERVTFHPNYSYAQFVGTYKPITVTSDKNTNITKEQENIINILKDCTKTGQEKYDLLYDTFKQDNLTRLPILLGLFTDDEFITKRADGTPSANENSVERNHGRAIRPFINLDSSKNSEIAYEYVPGPFIRTYIKAKKTGQNVLLLIEEINRANVAAVFGDIFQLLDRDENGNSEYPITTSEDLRKFLAKPENLGGTPDDYKTLSIPSNMYIWATMNSADQGVLPMDAAFKRRWEFEYIGINEGEDNLSNVMIPIPNGVDENGKIINYVEIEWNKLRRAINEKLKIIPGVNEDKLIGPFFIGNKTKIEKAASNPEDFCKSFKSKVLMYLFEDVCKMRPTALFDTNTEHPHYSDICSAFDEKGIGVFGFKNTDFSKTENSSQEAISEQA